MFSRLQALNIHVQGPEWEARFLVEREKAVEHILFCLKLFRMQMHRGNYFLMEHPAHADSWKIPEVVEFLKMGGVDHVVADQCMYGLKTRGSADGEELPAKKPTRFVSNSWCVLQELSTRCDRSHVHQQLMGGRAAGAAEYPDELCNAFCRGIANQLVYDRTGRVCAMKTEDLNSFVENTVNAMGSIPDKKPVSGSSKLPTSGDPDHWRQPIKNNTSLSCAVSVSLGGQETRARWYSA